MKNAILLLSVTLLLSCKHQRDELTATTTTPVRIALTNVPLPYLPVIIAQQMGFFQQAGLNVEMEDFSSASQVMQAMLSGSADVAAGTFEQDIQLAAQGRRVKAFALLTQQPSRVLVAVPTSKRRLRVFEDLKGTVVGVAALGSANHLFLNYVLAQHGLKPSDVTTVAIGVGSSAIAALERQRVDAAVLVGSETEVALVRIAGLRVLLDARGPENCRKVFKADNYPGAALISREAWLRENPKTARRVAKAIQASLQWISGNAPEEILQKLPAKYRMDDHQAEARALKTMIPGFSPDGLMSQNGAEAAKRMVAASIESVRNSPVDLSQSYTNEFLKQ